MNTSIVPNTSGTFNAFGTSVAGTSPLEARYDDAAKLLLSFRPVLGKLLTACIPACRDMTLEEAMACILDSTAEIADPERLYESRVIGMNTEVIFSKIGKAQYDLCFCILVKGRKIQVIIEMFSGAPKYSPENKNVFYLAASVVRQKNNAFFDDDYDSMQETYLISIMADPKASDRDTAYQYDFEKKGLFNHCIQNAEDYRGMMHMTDLRLGGSYETGEEIERIMKLLFTETEMAGEEKAVILENEFGMKTSEYMMEVMDDMCDLSRGLISIGEERGEKRGEKKAEKAAVIRLIQNGISDAVIAVAFPDLSEQEYHAYRQEALNA